MAIQWQQGAINAGVDAYVDWLHGPAKKYPPEYKDKSILVCLAPGTRLGDFRRRWAEVQQRLPGVKFPFLAGSDDLEH
jgi:hypothetical protein